MSLLPVGFGASGGYEIAKSLRFRASASAYLSRTPGSAGNRRTWTWSGWVKRGALGTSQFFWHSETNSSNQMYAGFGGATANNFRFLQYTGGVVTAQKDTTMEFRDPSAWYHVLLVWNTTDATSTNRMLVYINGVQVTAFSTSVDPTLNLDGFINNNTAHNLGRGIDSSTTRYFDGYLSEINFVDGQALTPSSFGEIDPITGVWVPKKYSGTYGTNGFYLPFNDGSNLTNLCLDRSGNGNNWTATNISLTAGATYDWMDDTPSNNFAVLNPLDVSLQIGSAINANLTHTWNATSDRWLHASITFSQGKYYAEFTLGNAPTSNGMAVQAVTGSTGASYNAWNGQVFINGSLSATVATATTNDIIGLAIDRDNNTLSFYKNNTLLHTGTSITAGDVVIRTYTGSNNTWHANFGQRPFAYTPPTGFLPLCTKNTGTIAPIASGSFTGNANADGPFVWLAGTPNSMTINGNAVTFGTHADRLANGFKVRTSSASYNAAGSNTFSVASFVDDFTDPNRAKGNP